jgi:hypothetical protein
MLAGLGAIAPSLESRTTGHDATAGIDVTNLGVKIHRQPAWNENRYSLTHHYANQSIDTESPDFTRTVYRSLVLTAQQGTQQDLDDACAACTGGWWAAQPSGYRAGMKILLADA